MSVYVYRNGEIVPRDDARRAGRGSPNSFLAAPRVSRMETFQSPVTGKDVSSWRERDRDMTAADACDPRDLPRKPFEKRKAQNERSKALIPEWRDPV